MTKPCFKSVFTAKPSYSRRNRRRRKLILTVRRSYGNYFNRIFESEFQNNRRDYACDVRAVIIACRIAYKGRRGRIADVVADRLLSPVVLNPKQSFFEKFVIVVYARIDNAYINRFVEFLKIGKILLCKRYIEILFVKVPPFGFHFAWHVAIRQTTRICNSEHRANGQSDDNRRQNQN